jgi:hypothetical protein
MKTNSLGSMWFVAVLFIWLVILFKHFPSTSNKPCTMPASKAGGQYHRPRIHQTEENALPLKKTLSFSVCNGFANQRLSLLYGVVIAKQLERSIYLPNLIEDGVQYTTKTNYGKGAPFESMYDREAFIKGLETIGVNVLPGSPPAVLESSVTITEEQISDLTHSREYDAYNHIPGMSTALSARKFHGRF